MITTTDLRNAAVDALADVLESNVNGFTHAGESEDAAQIVARELAAGFVALAFDATDYDPNTVRMLLESMRKHMNDETGVTAWMSLPPNPNDLFM